MSTRLPNDNQRIVIVGSTGSGKSVAGLWHLSHRDYHTKPWLIVDQKHDDKIAAINPPEIEPGEIPKKPGLYVTRPLPIEEHDEAMERALWKIWMQGNTGIFIDEGQMFQRSNALNSIYTQGRSKQIPVITNSQRPVCLSRFTFSEADFFQVFRLNDTRDKDTLKSMLPTLPKDYKLPAFHSLYYDVAADEISLWKPVPSEDQIISSFNLPKQKKRFFL